MKIIKCLSEMIGEELDDAEKYILKAHKYKDKYPEAADLFYWLSGEEMGHVNKLHDEVARLIEEYRKDNGDPPPEMQAIYDYLHEKHIEHAAEIKAMRDMYK